MRRRRGAPAVLVVVIGCGLVGGCAGADRAADGLPSATSPVASPSVASPLASGSTAITSPFSSPAPTTTTASATPTRTGRTSSAAAKAPVIVIDPGHSGRSIRSTDPTTGLTDFDYPNEPEMTEVYEVSACVAGGLRDLGYRVVMTKKNADDTVSLAERARIADKAHADLAISVHDDHSQTSSFQAVYSQRGIKHDGSYHPMWRGSGSTRTVFDRPAVAKASARYAKTIATRRGAVLGQPVSITEENFSGRSGLEPGNLALVQLLARVPWVYNEAGALTGSSTTRRMSKSAQISYAEGLLKGVVAAVPYADATGSMPSRHAIARCITQQRTS